MKAILEFKKEHDDCIFYRYNIDGTLVWFEQYKNSGHIYTVSVRPGDEINDDFRFYVQDGSRYDYYYPEFVEIHTNHERLNVDQVDDYVNGILYAKEVAKVIMEIFDNGMHKELYVKLHKED